MDYETLDAEDDPRDAQTSKKRSDRSQKLKERKLYKETIIKTSLQKYVEEFGKKEEFLEAIKKRVESFSKAMNLASIALCGMLKELFDGRINVKDVQIPKVFEQTFMRQMMLGLEDATKPYPEIDEFYRKYPELFPNPKRFQGDSNIYCAGGRTYITNFKNSLVMNFDVRILTYLKRLRDKLGFTKDEGTLAFYTIMGWKVPMKLETKSIKNKQLIQIVQEQRNILNLLKDEKVGPLWLKKEETLKNIIRQWVFFNRFYEAEKLSKFSIVPIASIRSKFISIDSNILYGVMKELEIITCNEKTFKTFKDMHWRSLFKIAKLEKTMRVHTDQTPSKEFTYSINTDGTALCTHFRQKLECVKTFKDQDISKEKFRILACDPGRVNIYTMVEEIGDTGKFRVYGLTRSQYYTESGVFIARENTEKWQKKIQNELKALSTVSIKGVDLQNHKKYLEVFLSVKDSLWAEYTKNRWSRQRLRLYGGKKRTFATFFDKIKKAGDPTKEIIVFYGSAKFAPGSRSELSVPTTRAYHECASRFRSIPTDEFRSSKVDYKTNQILKTVKNQNIFNINQNNTYKGKQLKGADRSLRGLLWCDSTENEESKFVNRDVNAAKNIYRCGMLQQRPLILSRSPRNSKLPEIVGRTIRTFMF